MRRGRAVFWTISGLLIAGGLGTYLYIQFVYLRQPTSTPPQTNWIEQDRQKRFAKDDIPPQPWSPANAWWKKVTIEAYDKANQGTSWPSARRAVVAFGADLSGDPPRTGDEQEDALAAADTAVEYSCEDPLILFIRARYMHQLGIAGQHHGEGPRAMGKAAEAFRTSTTYPPFIRCLALMETYIAAGTDGNFQSYAKTSSARLAEYLSLAQNLLVEVGADKDVQPQALRLLVEHAGSISRAKRKDRMEFLEPLFAALEKSGHSKSEILAAKGEALTSYAWDARGSGWASEVTEDGWKGFKDRLAQARATLKEAWELDNKNSIAAAQMITVCMGEGNRGDMEVWFKRAIEADPANFNAASRKLLFLEPKWGGSVVQMVMFGRELTQKSTDPRSVRLPLTLVDVHWQLAEYAGESRSAPLPEYFADNADLWDDVSRVYEKYLKQVPGSRYHRTRYAVIAAWAGKWEVANAQFVQLGEKYSKSVVGEGVVKALREQAKKKGAVAKGG